MTVGAGGDIPGFWIPACAGMTVGAAAGIRLEEAGVWIPAFAGMTVEGGDSMPGFWIPACAGMTVGAAGMGV